MRSAVLFLVACLAAVVFGGSPASAHSGIQSYVYVSLFDDGVEGRVEFPVNDLGPAFGIDFPADGPAAQAQAIERADEIIAYTDRHLDMEDESGEWTLVFSHEIGLVETGGVGDYLTVPFTVERSFDDVPRRWITVYDGIIEQMPERDALFIVENDWRSATFVNEGEHLLGFSVGLERQEIVIENEPVATSMWRIGQLGSQAVDRSLDQVLAVVAVAAAAVLAPRRARSTGVAEVVSDLRRVGVSIGLVVAGQSLSLWVLGVSGLAPSATVAGLAVAAGVVLASVSIWWAPDAPAAVNGAVGLLLGVGLAHTFFEQHLDRTFPLRTLLAFDLGVVITVAVVAAMVVPAMVLAARLPIGRPVAWIIGTIGVVMGLLWALERSTESIRFRFRTAEFEISDAITNPLIMLALTTVLAVAVARSSRSSASPEQGEGRTTPDRDRIEVS